MNRDDLLAHLIVSSGAWFDTSEQSTEPSSASRIHERLCEIAGFNKKSSLGGVIPQRGMQSLFDAINGELSEAMQTALNALDRALTLDCMMWHEVEDSSNVLHKFQSAFKNQPIFHYLVPDLRAWMLIQTQPAVDQLAIVDAVEKWANWQQMEQNAREYSETASQDDLHAMQKVASEAKAIYLDYERQLQDWWKEPVLQPSSIEVLRSVKSMHGGIGETPSPTVINRSMSWLEFLRISERCLNFSNRMAIEDPIDEAMPFAEKSQCRSSLEEFQDSAIRLKLLSGWIRSISMSIPRKDDEPDRRCGVCYRHLGIGERLFCTVHKRTAAKRPPSNTRYLRAEYLIRQKSFFLSSKKLAYLFSGYVLKTTLNLKQEREVARGWVDEDLVDCTALLMHLLRRLYMVVSPVFQDRIANHFVDMVKLAQATFDDKCSSLDSLERANRSEIRRRAADWLTEDNFFKTFYGKHISTLAKNTEFQPETSIWKGIDPQHPAAGPLSKTVKVHALHLSRIRSWIEAENHVEKNGYLDGEKARRLRRSVTKGKRALSYEAIAQKLGSSKQAVASALKSGGSMKSKPSRKRVLKRFMTENKLKQL